MIFVAAEKLFSAISKLDKKIEVPTIELTPEKINNNIKGYDALHLKTEVVANDKRLVSFFIFDDFICLNNITIFIAGNWLPQSCSKCCR